jgi:putative Mg2+ transporter-C (MgtC) family protein
VARAGSRPGSWALALVLSAAIGLEREIRQKNAGLRTHTLVGVGAALFMLISKYGFADVLQPGWSSWIPPGSPPRSSQESASWALALIFVRRDSVRGLPTAAGVWVTAAVGSAAGAGLPILAVLTTGIYLLVALAFPEVTRRLPRSATAVSAVRVRYPDGHGTLRDILRLATAQGFVIDDVQAETVGGPQVSSARDSSGGTRMVEVTLHVHGKQPVNDMAASLSDLENVQAVLASDVNAFDE